MTVRRLALAVVLLFATASAVQAQGHPCDQPAPTTVTILSGAPHRMSFCQPASDNPEAVLAMLDGAPIDLIAITAKSPASTTGLILFETTVFIQVARGTHNVTLATYNRNAITGASQLGPPSAPFIFAAVDDTPVAAAPLIKGIGR